MLKDVEDVVPADIQDPEDDGLYSITYPVIDEPPLSPGGPYEKLIELVDASEKLGVLGAEGA